MKLWAVTVEWFSVQGIKNERVIVAAPTISEAVSTVFDKYRAIVNDTMDLKIHAHAYHAGVIVGGVR